MEIYFSRYLKMMKFAVKVLDPYTEVEGKRRLSTYSKISLVEHISILTVIVLYIKSVEVKPFAEFSENIIVFVGASRNLVYLAFHLKMCDRTKALVNRICVEREETKKSFTEWPLTLKYCKKEFWLSMISAVATICGILIVFVAGVFVKENSLPMTFFITFLPFDGISVNWFLNCLHQFLAGYFCVALTFIHTLMTLFLMNHSCWSLDNLFLSVERLNHLSTDHEREKNLHDIRITKQLRKVIEKSLKIIKWQEDAQEYLKYMILLEFSLLSFIISGCTYTIMTDPKASTIVYVGLPFVFVELFVYCWIGTRVLQRFEKFEAQIYEVKWYLMNKKHRKDIQMILVMAQNMKGFNGIFNEVNMETFVKIVQFTYSMLTLLQSFN